MKLIISIVFALAVHQIQCEDEIQPRVIGNPVDEIQYELAVITPDGQVCTAALIDPYWAVTSASCASRSKRIRVHQDKEPDLQKADYIKDIYIHPAFNKVTLANDIALLELAVPPSKEAEHLEIPNLTDIFTRGEVSGYGGSATNSILQRATVPILDIVTCAKYTPMNAFKLCTGLSLVCDGDQGGPLVSDNKLVGIISVNDIQQFYCNTPNPFSQIVTYLRVAPYKAWIKSITKLNYL